MLLVLFQAGIADPAFTWNDSAVGWVIQYPYNTGIRTEPAIQLRQGSPKMLNGIAPFMDDFWYRLCFRINSGPGPDMPELQLIQYNFVGRTIDAKPESFLNLGVFRESGKFLLRCSLTVTADRADWLVINTQVEPNVLHTVETHARFPAPDTLELSFFLDNDSIFTRKSAYFLPKDCIYQRLFSLRKLADTLLTVDLEGIRVSRTRSYVEPATPVYCRDSLDRFVPVIFCSQEKSIYKGHQISAAHWRLMKGTDTNRILYQSVKKDPAFFKREKTRFPLDSGEFSWQVRLQNNFGLWSHWSGPKSILVREQRHRPFLVKDVFVTSPGKTRKQVSLVPGKSYDLHVVTSTAGPWANAGYVIMQLSHDAYQWGHPQNKGGAYLPDSNYPVNFSTADSFPRKKHFWLYEKDSGAIASRELITGKIRGKYIMDEPADARLDTTAGEWVIRIKLSDRVAPGPWTFSAWAWSKNEILSDIARAPLTMGTRNGKRKPWPIATAMVGSIVAILIAIRSRKRPVAVAPDREFKRITDYLSMHMQEEVSVDSIRRDLGLSSARFYSTLRRNNAVSLPKLLNGIRIEKAKELIRTTDKTFSEIGLETGFKELPYFTRVFRETTGQTPGAFKQSLAQTR